MESTKGNEGEVLWEPSPKTIEDANLTDYMQWLKKEKSLAFDNYAQLWQWSVNEIENFWQSLWEYFKIEASQPFAQVLSERGIAVHRVWLGPYATTQESAGFAISLCRLDPEMRALYDAPARGAAVQFMGSDRGVGS